MKKITICTAAAGLAAFFLMLFVPAGLHSITFDGRIEGGEYDFSSSFDGGKFVFHWKTDGETFYAAVEAEAKGWVSVGFDPLAVMDQADMVIGWVEDDKTTRVLDCFSTGMFGPHPEDTSLGGTNDITGFAGREEKGMTVIEFSRPLSTGDAFDKEITSGKDLKIIWAYSSSDDFDAEHEAAGSASIGVSEGETHFFFTVPFMILHILFMSLALVTMLAAIVTARYFRSKKWWLKIHRPLGIGSGVLAGLGLVSGIIFVEISSGRHLRLSHSWFGIVTLLLVLATPLLGQAFLKVKSNKKRYRFLHSWSGRITLSLMGLTAYLGIKLLGLL